MNKTLTISIAGYNIEKYIEQVVDSLLVEEILDDLEILIINDGSKDRTAEIGARYQELYPNSVKVINKENGGWGSTVNEGMKLATGKYFKLLDGDDWYYSENLVEFITFLKKVDVDMVLSAFGMYDDELRKVYALKEMPFETNKKYEFEKVANVCDIQMHGFAVSREVLKKANIHIVDHCFYTDTQFVAELCANVDSMMYFNKPIYCYRLGREGQSVSPSGLLKHMGDNCRVAKELLEYKNTINLTPNKEQCYDEKINYAITMEYYSYAVLKGEERKKKVCELGQFIQENGIDFKPSSTEVRLHLKLGFRFANFIHCCFEGTRKVAKLLHIDLVQHVK